MFVAIRQLCLRCIHKKIRNLARKYNRLLELSVEVRLEIDCLFIKVF